MRLQALAAVLLALAACASQNRQLGPEDRLTALREGPPVAPDAAWTLERSGPSPADTVVTFVRREGRRVVLRHGAPDNAVFLILDFPADTTAPPGETLQVEARPLPAIYAVTLAVTGTLPPGATGSFSYAMHFTMPGEATGTYPTPTRFDQMLSAARQTEDGKLQYLVSRRLASDMIRFPLTQPGTYLLVAPK